jgi:hypothetical protein
MRELIVQCHGEPFRILYAFDPRRTAILLIGGNKTGDNRWYEVFVPIADRLYEQHLATLKKEAKGAKEAARRPKGGKRWLSRISL